MTKESAYETGFALAFKMARIKIAAGVGGVGSRAMVASLTPRVGTPAKVPAKPGINTPVQKSYGQSEASMAANWQSPATLKQPATGPMAQPAPQPSMAGSMIAGPLQTAARSPAVARQLYPQYTQSPAAPAGKPVVPSRGSAFVGAAPVPAAPPAYRPFSIGNATSAAAQHAARNQQAYSGGGT